MAADASASLASASSPPSATAWVTQWPRCSSSRPKRDRLQGTVHGADLGEDIDAVLVLFDHLRDAADLALDAAQPLGVVVLLL